MNSPFPGMDPYLQERWSDVHVKLITHISEAIQQSLPEDLRARAEQRVLLETEDGESNVNYEPDVALLSVGREHPFATASNIAVAEPLVVEFESTAPLFHRFIQVIDVRSGNKVITVIEVLSPWNKKPGRLNREYREKLNDYLAAGVSVVEIDLIRASRKGLRVTEKDIASERLAAYYACVHRGWIVSDKWEVYSLSLRLPLGAIPIPLRKSEPDAVLQLQPLIDHIYLAGRHDDIDYHQPLDPRLSADDQAWMDQLLKSAGRR